MQQLLHTPEGVRDIYHVECVRKNVLQRKLAKTLHLFGYQDIQTPTFEFFDVFRKEIGTTSSKELYKFFDRDGNTLAMRPDITPQIARIAATLFSEEDFPARLCYMENTYINHSSYQGRLRENTQLGAELVGDDSIEADAEMLALVIDCLKASGLTDFQINIGNVDFLQSLIQSSCIEEDIQTRLRELINNRNFFGVDELLIDSGATLECKHAFSVLPELIGGHEILDLAKSIAPDAKSIKAIKRLEATYRLLCSYGVDQYISFDLSMCGIYGYYTGIIFRGYTYGTGDAIVKGGRYDHLIEKFGKEMPSIGFAIIVDELLNAVHRQNIDIPNDSNTTLILYDESRRDAAVYLAKDFREKGKNTELVKYISSNDLDFYTRFAKRKLIDNILYLQENHQIKMINLITGEQKIIAGRD